jgi:hypothetical protein
LQVAQFGRADLGQAGEDGFAGRQQVDFDAAAVVALGAALDQLAG